MNLRDCPHIQDDSRTQEPNLSNVSMLQGYQLLCRAYGGHWAKATEFAVFND
jgi:hypothetical protein